MEHQDWTEVVFKKRKTTAPEPQRPPKYLSQLDNEEFTVQFFEKEYVQQVIQSRVARNLTQKQLAINLNLDIAIIQKLEQGKLPYDHVLKNKLSTHLGIATQK